MKELLNFLGEQMRMTNRLKELVHRAGGRTSDVQDEIRIEGLTAQEWEAVQEVIAREFPKPAGLPVPELPIDPASRLYRGRPRV